MKSNFMKMSDNKKNTPVFWMILTDLYHFYISSTDTDIKVTFNFWTSAYYYNYHCLTW